MNGCQTGDEAFSPDPDNHCKFTGSTRYSLQLWISKSVAHWILIGNSILSSFRLSVHTFSLCILVPQERLWARGKLNFAKTSDCCRKRRPFTTKVWGAYTAYTPMVMFYHSFTLPVLFNKLWCNQYQWSCQYVTWPATFQLLNDGPSLREGNLLKVREGGYQMKPGPLHPVHCDASHMLST